MATDRFQRLAECVADVTLLVNGRGDIDWVSTGVRHELGWHAEDLVGRPLQLLLDPQEAPMHTSRLSWARQAGEPDEYVTHVRTSNGNFVDMRIRVSTFVDQDAYDTVVTLRRVADDCTPPERLTVTHSGANAEDPSTVAVARALDALLNRTERTGRANALGIVVVEGFTHLVSAFGFPATDLAVRSVAERIISACRSGDVVARSAGDELAIALQGVHDATDAAATLQRLQRHASTPVRIPGGTIQPVLSVGVCLLGSDASTDSARAARATARGHARASALSRPSMPVA